MYTVPGYNSPGLQNKNPYSGGLSNRAVTIPTTRRSTMFGRAARQQQQTQTAQPVQQQQQTTPAYTQPSQTMQSQSNGGIPMMQFDPKVAYEMRLHDNGGPQDQAWAEYDKKYNNYTQPSSQADIFNTMGWYQGQKPTENDKFDYVNADGSSVRMLTPEYLKRENDNKNKFMMDQQLNRAGYATPMMSRPTFG